VLEKRLGPPRTPIGPLRNSASSCDECLAHRSPPTSPTDGGGSERVTASAKKARLLAWVQRPPQLVKQLGRKVQERARDRFTAGRRQPPSGPAPAGHLDKPVGGELVQQPRRSARSSPTEVGLRRAKNDGGDLFSSRRPSPHETQDIKLQLGELTPTHNPAQPTDTTRAIRHRNTAAAPCRLACTPNGSRLRLHVVDAWIAVHDGRSGQRQRQMEALAPVLSFGPQRPRRTKRSAGDARTEIVGFKPLPPLMAVAASDGPGS
jgi:hypothetical protein